MRSEVRSWQRRDEAGRFGGGKMMGRILTAASRAQDSNGMGTN